MMIVAVVVIAVIVVAIAAVLLMGGNDDGSDGTGEDGDVIEWDPAVGDYYEYTMYTGDIEIGKMAYRVTAVTSTTMTLNVTSSFMGVKSFNETTVPLGQSTDYLGQIENPPSGYDISDKGYQSISTNWGTMITHHYQMTYSEGGSDVTVDIWIYKGMLIRMSAGSGGSDVTMELTDTNISEIAD
ncbi:MAG: hypothetical protein LLG16_00790 [Euryarchaeota archaeon]|nr:hypothetical protein [Euryarchaeota archaeon]